jgi:hypothetical protein
MSWLSESIMYRRGVAHGKVTATHTLTEAVQGTSHYTIGPYSTPVLHVAPGAHRQPRPAVAGFCPQRQGPTAAPEPGGKPRRFPGHPYLSPACGASLMYSKWVK